MIEVASIDDEMLAAAEQVLIKRWQQTVRGRKWLEVIANSWHLDTGLEQTISAPDWANVRRRVVEGVSREHEAEPFPDDDLALPNLQQASNADVAAWRAVLDGRASRAALAPYLPDHSIPVPSLLTRWHGSTLIQLPAPLRRLAARMMRRLVRSPGFLSRFILDESAERPDPNAEGEDVDRGWTELIHRRWNTTPATGESARERFEAYLEMLRKSIGLPEQVEAYNDASRNRDVVTRVTGAVAGTERDRLFVGFNTPLLPEVLIVTTVGQEGIDLHAECRHVIHHDLPWNPATLEQRTGRVDRIGSKAERLSVAGRDGSLNIVVPYIAKTYDEHRFDVLQGRAHLFDVTLGGQYSVDGHRQVNDAMEREGIEDDEGAAGPVWTEFPAEIAEDLRLRLGVQNE